MSRTSAASEIAVVWVEWLVVDAVDTNPSLQKTSSRICGAFPVFREISREVAQIGRRGGLLTLTKSLTKLPYSVRSAAISLNTLAGNNRETREFGHARTKSTSS